MSILSEITRITGNIADAYAAVSGKGGTLPTARNSDNLPAAIESIPSGIDTSDATAVAGDILSPKTAYVNGQKIIGTMSTASLPTSLSTSASGTRKMTVSRQTSKRYINIPAGYNASAAYYQISAVANGSVTVGTPTINSSTGLVTGTASVSAGYVSGTPTSKTLQLTTQAAKTVTPTTADQTAVASGRYTTGAVTVKGDTNLKAENIASGVTIFGVTGTHSGGGETANLTFDFMGGDGVIGVMTVGETYGYAVYTGYTSYGDFQNRLTGVLSIPVPQLVYAAYNSMGGTGHFTGNVTKIAGDFWLVTGDCDFNGGGLA